MTSPFTFEGLTEPRQWLRLAEDRARQGRYEDALRAHEQMAARASDVIDDPQLVSALDDAHRVVAARPLT